MVLANYELFGFFLLSCALFIGWYQPFWYLWCWTYKKEWTKPGDNNCWICWHVWCRWVPQDLVKSRTGFSNSACLKQRNLQNLWRRYLENLLQSEIQPQNFLKSCNQLKKIIPTWLLDCEFYMLMLLLCKTLNCNRQFLHVQTLTQVLVLTVPHFAPAVYSTIQRAHFKKNFKNRVLDVSSLHELLNGIGIFSMCKRAQHASFICLMNCRS